MLWLLMNVPYTGCFNGPVKDSSRMSCGTSSSMPPTKCTITDGHMYYFDRYNTSIKDATWWQRACEASGEY